MASPRRDRGTDGASASQDSGPFHQARNGVRWSPSPGREEVPPMKHMVRQAVPPAPPAPPGSLAAALAVVPDPRRPYGWRPDAAPVPLVALLQLTVVGLL